MELLHYINPKADPCDDFYLFSCGNFLQNTNLENAGSRSVSAAAEEEIQNKLRNMLEEPTRIEDRLAFQKAKIFYRACTNETQIELEGLAGIRNIFKLIGGWPTLRGGRWNEDQFRWDDAVHKLRAAGVNVDFFFSVTVDKNKEDETKYVLGVSIKKYYFIRSIILTLNNIKFVGNILCASELTKKIYILFCAAFSQQR